MSSVLCPLPPCPLSSALCPLPPVSPCPLSSVLCPLPFCHYKLRPPCPLSSAPRALPPCPLIYSRISSKTNEKKAGSSKRNNGQGTWGNNDSGAFKGGATSHNEDPVDVVRAEYLRVSASLQIYTAVTEGRGQRTEHMHV